MFLEYIDNNMLNWVILPLFIFIARITDVTLGTIRVIFISKSFKRLAALLGFFEILVWIFAVRQIFLNLDNLMIILAYCVGFATGNYIGILIENKLSIGKAVIRIITKKKSSDLLAALSKSNNIITVTDTQSSAGKVKVLFSIVRRSDLQKVINLINRIDPYAYYSISDVSLVKQDNKKKCSYPKQTILKYFKRKK